MKAPFPALELKRQNLIETTSKIMAPRLRSLPFLQDYGYT